MKFKLFPITILLLAVVAFLVYSGVPLIAAGGQHWNLDSHEDADILIPAYLCQMERTFINPGDDGQSGQILITSQTHQIWIANEISIEDVTFSAESAWELELVIDQDWGVDDQSIRIEIGEWIDNGTADEHTFRPFEVVDFGPPCEVYNSPEKDLKSVLFLLYQEFSSTVFEGNYLAVRVTNLDSSSHTVYCGENEYSSCLTSPGGDPGYPVPEIAAVIAAGGGLISLGLVLFIRKKRAALRSL